MNHFLRLGSSNLRFSGDALELLTARLGVRGLSAFGITAADIPAIVADSHGSSMKTNPVALTDDEIAAILRESLQAPFEVEGQVLIIDGSVGVSLAPDHGRDVGELLRCADIAMYVAKGNSLGVLVYAEEDADEGESRGPGRGRAGRRAADVPLHTDVEPG